MTEPLNQYGDQFRPTEDGRGVDIASQRMDELDKAALDFIRAAKKPVSAVDLGGGFGAHAVRMVEAGADVTMIDAADMRTAEFRNAEKGAGLRFLQKDFTALQPEDIPEGLDVLYSQRAIHYVPHAAAQKLLRMIFNRMAQGGAVFISAAGWDTEYGKTYPDRGKPVEERFNYVTPDMQEKHGITHKIVTYREEEMAALLAEAGFAEVKVTHSAFGNIKATARKI